jgi:RND family efflux transporter MFP subunit
MKRYLLPLFIVLAGSAAAVVLIFLRPEPQRQASGPAGTLVKIRTVHPKEEQLTVQAAGTVRPSQSVVIQPQVGGRLVRINPGLVPGGLVREGEHLVTIEQEEYRLALEARESDLAEAGANLLLEEGRQEVAEDEWQRYFAGPDVPQADKSLATREPQMHIARARVERAAAQVDRSVLDLARTSIRAPFNAVVSEESAALGQLVNNQSRIAVLLSTDEFWVEVAVPAEFLPVIDIPGINADQGSPAVVLHEYGDEQLKLAGEVFRLLPDLDPAGRMARLLVRVEDPYRSGSGDAENVAGSRLPLLVGAYVDVEIEGPRRQDLIEIPRTALRNGTEVYVVDEKEILEIRKVKIAWHRRDTVLVSRGLADGDRVIVSRIAAPVEGMPLRLAESKPAARDQSDE